MEARILVGDVRTRLAALEDGSVRCVVTSPPYWGLRDYGRDGQIGLEQTPEEFVGELVAVFREVRRVLADDGTLWLNLGDSYAAARGGTHQPAETLAGGRGGYTDAGERVNRSRHDGYNPSRNARSIGLKHKDLVGIPWRVAFALQADGWYLRQDIIWSKPNPMPESVTDRCTKAHEYVFLLTKSPRYYYDKDAVSEEYADATVKRGKSIRQVSADGTVTTRGNGEPVEGRRNRRSVWTVATKPFRGAHFAVMPEPLVEPCVLAGSAEGDLVLDPFAGSGTVGVVALRHGRNFVGVELNADYAKVAQDRIYDAAPMMNTVTVIGEDDE
jgi:DNA modification methylase